MCVGESHMAQWRPVVTAIWAAIPTHTSRAVSVLRNSRCQKKPSVFACLSKFARNSIVQRDGQAQEGAQAKLERNWRWFERKKSTFLVRAANAPVRRRMHPMESSILRLTRAVQTTSVASTPQNVSGLAVGQGNHARIFVDLRLCGDRSACRVLTPPSASAPTELTSSKLRFWHALKGKINEEKTFRQGSWTVNCRLTTEKVCSFSPEGRSSEIVQYAAAFRTLCEKIALVKSTMYRPEVSRSAQTKKSTQRCGHTHVYLAIKASISAHNAANLCSHLLD